MTDGRINFLLGSEAVDFYRTDGDGWSLVSTQQKGTQAEKQKSPAGGKAGSDGRRLPQRL